MRSLLLVVVLLAAACSPTAPAAYSPGGVVSEAVAKLAAKDLDGLRSLACAGQEDVIRDQLGLGGLSGSGSELIPGLDTQALLAAVTLDVKDLRIGEPAVSDDVAIVPVTGSVKATFDPVAMRPLVQQLLARQGQTMSDEQLDALLATLESYGQDVPVDQTIRLVRENGAWKVCQETLQAPASP